jgi:siderophore synthetase component
MNALLNLSICRNTVTPPTSMALISSDAHRRSLHRLVQALLREGFLCRQDFINEGSVTWLPLWGQKRMLRIEGLSLGRAGHCQIRGTISVHQSGQSPRVIHSANELLKYILADTSTENTRRLQSELANSAENDALCHHYRQQWKQELQKGINEAGHTSLISALLDAANPVTDNPALLFEQWGCIGHPFHPGHKSKTGLSAEEVMALSPEFKPQLELVVGALKASVARVSNIAATFSYRDWMTAQFPKEMAAWTTALHKLGEDPQNWLPLPIHPYQAQHVLPQKFAEEISAGVLQIGSNFPRMRVSPTLSFRTMACSENPLAPQLKLPVSLQLTSAQRTVSPKATIMGPRVSNLMRELISKEDGFGKTLDILAEEVGMHYIDPDGDADRAKHLSILFRENPMTRRESGYLPVPVAALFADSPVDGRAIILELVTRASGDHANGALSYFRDYAQTVLQASLSAYLVYGIAFEAHQQNSLVLLNDHGKAVQLILRDFGDIRIHTPTLHARNMQIENHQSGHILFDDEVIVREKFLHTTMLCHLAELAVLLARSYQQNEDVYWQILHHITATLFDQLRERCDICRWEKERHAILHADWPVKSLLRMRLGNTTDDICLSMPNPLTDFSSRK